MAPVIPQTALLVASLRVVLAANDVQEETVARKILVFFQLEDVATLDAALLHLSEALAPLGGDVLLNKPGVDFKRGPAELFIRLVVDGALREDAGYSGDHQIDLLSMKASGPGCEVVECQQEVLKSEEGVAQEHEESSYSLR